MAPESDPVTAPLGPLSRPVRMASGDVEKTLWGCELLSSRREEEEETSASVSPLSFRPEEVDSSLGCLRPRRPSLSAMATKLVRTLASGRGEPEALAPGGGRAGLVMCCCFCKAR